MGGDRGGGRDRQERRDRKEITREQDRRSKAESKAKSEREGRQKPRNESEKRVREQRYRNEDRRDKRKLSMRYEKNLDSTRGLSLRDVNMGYKKPKLDLVSKSIERPKMKETDKFNKSRIGEFVAPSSKLKTGNTALGDSSREVFERDLQGNTLSDAMEIEKARKEKVAAEEEARRLDAMKKKRDRPKATLVAEPEKASPFSGSVVIDDDKETTLVNGKSVGYDKRRRTINDFSSTTGKGVIY